MLWKKHVAVFQWLFYPGLSVMCVVSVHEVDDLPWHVVEVEDRRICVQAGGMELVTVFHGQFSKGSEVLFLHSVDHLYHPVWDHGVSSVLQVQGQRRQRLWWSAENMHQMQPDQLYQDTLTTLLVRSIKTSEVITLRRQLVCTLVCIPEVLPTSLRSALAC